MSVQSLPPLTLLDRLQQHAVEQQNKPAIVDHSTGIEKSYVELVEDVALVKRALLELQGQGSSDLEEARVALLAPQGYGFVAAQFGIWASGGISLPLLPANPLPELLYPAKDSGVTFLVVHTSIDDRSKGEESKILGLVKSLKLNPEQSILILGDSPILIPSESQPSDIEVPPVPAPDEAGSKQIGIENDHSNAPPPLDASNEFSRRAMILYTSGSTGSPKGVVSTHGQIEAQVSSLVEAWEWNENDRILHVLPLNHIHGIINALHCPLYVGATVEFLKFNAGSIWERILSSSSEFQGEENQKKDPLTLFFAVPTIYSRLMNHFKTFSKEDQLKATEACKQFRLMVSGSAPLPSSAKREFEIISGGQVLLERYGMSETCMILSAGMNVESRKDGHVGLPLPKVQVRLWSETKGDVTEERDVEGEVQVRGPTVFKEYYNKPEATAKEFVQAEDGGDDWFKTGDIAVRSSDTREGLFRLLGRSSVDIIKSGGEKISALEIETALISIPSIKDAVVIALPDSEWGQIIAAILVVDEESGIQWDFDSIKKEMKNLVANYKVPKRILFRKDLPRNGMGKVQKKNLVSLFD